ncbi:hypothetical protein [Melittangium boletus]|uniref:Uncharacterized protein n=1 Tax=Melittangium boletus DSM 14713 TaxID=1294270 RepID=A0A250IGF4_9BACT|nr:hypothetical protein [Melittangium boletus]ATB30300.1 hypothetical protein MEBOL_003760 [Melittangium boletus DSM 14713]
MVHTFGKVALALLASVTAPSSLPLDEQGTDLMEKAATTATICFSSATPAGWVDIQWYYSSSCGTGSFAPNTKRIQLLTGEPIGTRVNACNSSYVPAGWVQTAYYYNSSCQSGSVGSLNPNTWTLQRVN